MEATGNEYTRLDNRTYSFAEALHCHDFDLSNSPLGGDVCKSEVPKATIQSQKYQPWKVLKPIRRKKKSEYLPSENVGLISYVFCTWLTPLIIKAYKHGLNIADLWQCGEQDTAGYNSERLTSLWHEEIQKKGKDNASLKIVFWKFCRSRVIIACVCQLTFCLACFGNVLIVHALLQYVQGTESNLPYALSLVFAILLTEGTRSLSLSCHWQYAYQTSMRIRSAFLTVVYKKVLSLQNVQDQTVGQIINLCTNDGQRIFDGVGYAAFVVGGPVLAIICIIYTTYILGPVALLGSSLFFLAHYLQILVSKAIAHFRVKAIKITDKRVRIVNEMITSVKLIKMYAWEKPFSKKIADIRSKEDKVLRKSRFLLGLNQSINQIVQPLALISTFTIHVALGNELTPAMAYTVVSMFTLTRFLLVVGPTALKNIAESFVAINRMKKLLLVRELKPFMDKPDDKNVAIAMSMATFGWDNLRQEQSEKKSQKINGNSPEEREMISDRDEDTQGNGENEKFVETLHDIDLNVKKGQLVGVCGSVGSGKSSLISAILAQMQLMSGTVAVGGSIAYVSQQAWIFNATLRENILFGLQYNQKLYEAALFSACLQEDIEQLPNGDKTEIGERGINLSGGQKQRVSLARALYASQDIYLLDDPLSAVDVQVGKHIFNHYIKGALCGKSVLFVTHQLQYLSGCDYILVMKDGRIGEHGTHQQLMLQGGQYATLIDTYHSDDKVNNTSSSSSGILPRYKKHPSSLRRSKSFQGNSHEEKKHPEVHSASSLKHLVVHSASSLNKLSSEVIFTRTEKRLSHLSCSTIGDDDMEGIENAFESKLTTAEEKLHGNEMTFNGTNSSDSVITVNLLEDTDVSFFVTVYGIILGATIICIFVKCLFYVMIAQKGASNLHDKLFVKVFRSPISFFDTTPSGRILNRFSKDQDEVDTNLPHAIEHFLHNLTIMSFHFLTICLVFPWYLVALVPCGFIYGIVFKYYNPGMRDLKRLENISRSPWFSQITETLQGLPTIHAYNKKQQFYKKFTEQLDVNAVAFYLFHVTSRWTAVRLNSIAMLTTFLTALFTVLTHGKINPAYSGIALSYSIQLTGTISATLRHTNEAQARFTSVERIYYYMNLISEAASIITGCRPPDRWPHKGHVQVDDLKVRYRDNLPLALKGVSFEVKPVEKIGIVGRTGAGKSSLCLSVFRLMEAAAGTIKIDGIDISTIGLEDLRSRLSIIPQDPVLFVGTIRYNLDPFDQYSDETIWKALEKCYLKHMVSQLDGKLEAPVMENGENFSVGERQLICLARALLRSCKILMLDEATAAIDTETDSLIQQTIRDAFKDCTMLIIAHRLNTVLNCDKILVMDNGKVLEFDKPDVLLASQTSRFSIMMAAAETTKEYLT
ncbi:ATP-binding cassette sub-family C member 5-like isoform X2 [Glandiceps talaboti]